MDRRMPDNVRFERFCINEDGDQNYTVIQGIVHPKWHNDFNSNYDCAVLNVDRPVSKDNILNCVNVDQKPAAGLNMQVIGFPIKIQRTDKSTIENNTSPDMYESAGRILGYSCGNNNVVHYNAMTYGGNSGGPIFISDTSVLDSVGFHTTGSDYTNSGILFTKEIVNFMDTSIIEIDTKGDCLTTDLVKSSWIKKHSMFSNEMSTFIFHHINDFTAFLNNNGVRSVDRIADWAIDFYNLNKK